MNDKRRKTSGSLWLIAGVLFVVAAWFGQNMALLGVALLFSAVGLEALGKSGENKLE